MKLKIIGLLLLCLSTAIHAKETVSVYVYHLKPPLITDLIKQRGIYFDFSRYLNERTDEYQFETIFVPRKRINKMLKEQKLDGLVLGVNPIWFQDKAKQKYLWSEKILTDQDDFVSLKASPFEYQGPSSLESKILGGVRGFYYFGVNELVEQKKITRVDTVSEEALLHMLLNNRVDTAIISKSALLYLTSKKQRLEELHLSNKPHDIFDRSVMFTQSQKTLFEDISPIINNMQYDEQWLKIVANYQ